MKTAELTGAALDWAVARCEGHSAKLIDGRVTSVKDIVGDLIHFIWEPSTNWSQGGPIIERERLDVYGFDGENWCANDNLRATQYGQTPLIAAMRCYVASKLGEDVDVPEELL